MKSSNKGKDFCVFALPGLFCFLAVVMVPFIYGIYLTLTDWNGVSSVKNFVGLSNFAAVMRDAQFWKSLLLTFKYVIAVVVLVNVIAFLLAYILTRGIKGQNFFRAGFFTPNLIGGIVLGYIWQLLLNGILMKFSRTLTYSSTFGFWGLVILMCWQQIGYMMIIYIAGLQNVSDDLIEAAAIDGASPWETLWKVKLPMVMPSITICVFLTLTNSFKLFDQNLALTGGDPNHMTEMMALNIYQTFYARAGAQWKGLGQSKAVLFCLLVIVISMIQLKATRSKEVQQ